MLILDCGNFLQLFELWAPPFFLVKKADLITCSKKFEEK